MGVWALAAGLCGGFQVPAHLLIEVSREVTGSVGSWGAVSEDRHVVRRANGEPPAEEAGDAGRQGESGQ